MVLVGLGIGWSVLVLVGLGWSWLVLILVGLVGLGWSWSWLVLVGLVRSYRIMSPGWDKEVINLLLSVPLEVTQSLTHSLTGVG